MLNSNGDSPFRNYQIDDYSRLLGANLIDGTSRAMVAPPVTHCRVSSKAEELKQAGKEEMDKENKEEMDKLVYKEEMDMLVGKDQQLI